MTNHVVEAKWVGPRCPTLSMARCMRVLAIALVTFLLQPTGLQAQTTAPLLQKQDLVYQGTFRVPNSDYGGGAIAYNAANNSLFTTGHDWYQQTAEISIPTATNTTNPNNLVTAQILQPYVDATAGRRGSVNPGDPNGTVIGGYLVADNKLHISVFSFYDASGTQLSSHFTRPLDLSSGGSQVQGPFKIGSDAHFTSAYMGVVPPEWQSLLGGPALIGNCCRAIISVQSSGPSISVFNPSSVGAAPAPATRLLGYPAPYTLGPGATTTNNIYNLATSINGVVFPRGTRSVLFFGLHGTGRYCYGEASECGGDPVNPYKGNHAYPYVTQVWAYDANDLLAVKQGSKQQHQVQPYAIWTMDLPFGVGVSGATYDPATGRIFLLKNCATGVGDCAAVVHVLKVGQGAAAPLPPQNVTAQ